MGVSVLCCSKEKEKSTEVVSKREEEEFKDRDLEKVRARVVEQYKSEEKKIIYLQNFIRFHRFRKAFKINLKKENEKLKEYINSNNLYLDENIEFDSQMHPLVKKCYNDFLKKKGVFAIKELENEFTKYRDNDLDEYNDENTNYIDKNSNYNLNLNSLNFNSNTNSNKNTFYNKVDSNKRLKQIFSSTEANPITPEANSNRKENNKDSESKVKPIWLDKEKKILY